MANAIIHRDHTFEYRGEKFHCTRQGPYGSGDSVWEVYRDRDQASAGMFSYLFEIREYIDYCAANGWSLIEGEK